MQRVLWKISAGAWVLVIGTAATLSLRHPSRIVDAAAATQRASSTSWTTYGGSNSDAQYSALKQVDRTNAGQLQQVWFYPSGNNGFRYGSNPLVVDGVMFVYGKNNTVVALDATIREGDMGIRHAQPSADLASWHDLLGE